MTDNALFDQLIERDLGVSLVSQRCTSVVMSLSPEVLLLGTGSAAIATIDLLDKGDLIGRFDPVLDRRTGTLYHKALYLEDRAELDEALLERLAGAMRDFMRFHSATDLVVERSVPKGFGSRLVRSLQPARI